jgi:hypothetical protein
MRGVQIGLPPSIGSSDILFYLAAAHMLIALTDALSFPIHLPPEDGSPLGV